MYDHSARPAGLFDPSRGRAACGVGFICHMSGKQSHEIVRQGIQILENLGHRGATGCDERTGDGAGIQLQISHTFFQAKCEALGIVLPAEGTYGVGPVFLPRGETARRRCMELMEEVVEAEGQKVLGWREVPTDHRSIGVTARMREPAIWQIFIGRGAGVMDAAAFERKLFVIRKLTRRRIASTDLPGKNVFYIPSLSARTIVYKGMLTVDQLDRYYPDLSDPKMTSALALYHSRFSTNTMPRWSLAQPFRFLCHNGEINTLRGNVNWMNTREALFESDLFGEDMQKLLPILNVGDSDSAILDNALELLYFTGRSLPHAILMLIPEAWERHEQMSEEHRAFYEYHSCLMEPWDGPATVPFTDGRYIGAVLDRNGLRPSRYTITKDGLVVLASETGVLDIDSERIEHKGRLQPGRMFLIDLEEKRRVSDEEIKDRLSRRRPYRQWLRDQMVTLDDIPAPPSGQRKPAADRRTQQQAFGYTREDLRLLMAPMGATGKETIGSMGDDTPLAVLSDRPRLLYDYFKQLFAQVTNPPLDAIREELVTSLFTHLGREGDLFKETPAHCRQLRLDQPVLTDEELTRVRALDQRGLRTYTIGTLFDVNCGREGLEEALDRIREEAARAIDDGYSILVLSDRGVDECSAPIPALLATAAVHHHLIREGKRTRCGLIIESGEPREVHHFCLLLGYGAGAINPYLALDTIDELVGRGEIDVGTPGEAVQNYIKAIDTGILKVMSKMGISTLESYRGAQIFEAVGLGRELVDEYFTGTASRLDGVDLDVLADEARQAHARAYPTVAIPKEADRLEEGGRYHWRRNGEYHQFNPRTIARLQHAVRHFDPEAYDDYAEGINDQNRRLGTLRGLLDFNIDASQSIPLEEVEAWTEIARRFKTGAMSYGSISEETHETLAIAMNRIGGKSNTGEGGEHPDRYRRDNPSRSAIKQVASGRFGVTIGYLASADEIQIKMAQGAKPGEGGQLPGKKVYPWIAEVRHSTPYVGLISPPPHHDIYSIEDLAQLIHDLKNSNKDARISVKLVSEVGVGTIASGVAKGKADVVLISGYDGGTGASPRTSLAHAGLPWELGLAETNQSLVQQGLRSRITVECDGQLKTGRDVAVAALLGADEFGFSTAPLVALGCTMMRKCHLNTCPVGIATQDPELRKLFTGEPEHVVNYFRFIAEELRQIMARLGFRTMDEMVGRVDRLVSAANIDHWKARQLDLSPILAAPQVPEFLKPFSTDRQDHGLDKALDLELIEQVRPALEDREPVEVNVNIRNTNRTVGTMLSNEITNRYGEEGLPEDTIILNCSGSAGQSFAAFGAPGMTMRIRGDANDYFGKGLSGAKLVLRPPADAAYIAEENIIVGNVALYGATSGEAYLRGRAGERFCVRNSGVRAVVEGVGDHGCEYMTNGRVVVLGTTGRNFAAGMSGGIAYVWDRKGQFASLCNQEMVELMPVARVEDVTELRSMIENHHRYTGSRVARRVLDTWHEVLGQFVKVMPTEYRRALERLEREREAA